MSKCQKCDNGIGYMEYYCLKCKRKLAGSKPKKSRDLCNGCRNTFYNYKYHDKNPFGGKGCMSYKTSKVIIKNIYYSLNQIVPDPRWALSCFNKKY